jgi:hypothetical protein
VAVCNRYSTLYWYVFNNFQTLMAAAEIVRRMVWGFLRLEWEHIERYGTAPVSPSGVEALRREQARVKAARGQGKAESSGSEQAKFKSSEEENSSRFMSSLELQQMPIGQSSSQGASKGAGVSVVHWEWVGHYSDWVDCLLTQYSPGLLGKMAAGHSFSSHIWIARFIEAIALTGAILLAMAVAAFGG